MADIISHELHGRRKILSSVDEITESNVLNVVEQAMNVHLLNKSEIDYLYKYYKGDQPVLRRVKKNRADILNNVPINYANEIVSFKVGYEFGIPMQYTANNVEDDIPQMVERLNNYMSYENKAKKDKELGEWRLIAGTGYKIALPDKVVQSEEDEAPFEINVLKPGNTFVIYSNKIGEKPLAGVTYWLDGDWTSSEDAIPAPLEGVVVAVYTPNRYFEIKSGQISIDTDNNLKMIPIIEYPLNNARMGAFEVVIDILNAISTVESNRVDGIEQFIQAFIKFVNCDISEEDYDKFLEKGAIKVFSHEGANADVDMVTSELSQTQTQTLIDDLRGAVLTICGIPSQGNANTSDSSNNGAMLIKNGWSSAETRAKDSEVMFEASERELLKIVLKVIRKKEQDFKLKVSDVTMKFPRRNYEDIQSKVQALVSMLNNEKIHPKDAYAHSGLFTDPETASENGLAWYREQLEAWNVKDVGDEDKNDVSRSGQATGEDTGEP